MSSLEDRAHSWELNSRYLTWGTSQKAVGKAERPNRGWWGDWEISMNRRLLVWLWQRLEGPQKEVVFLETRSWGHSVGAGSWWRFSHSRRCHLKHRDRQTDRNTLASRSLPEPLTGWMNPETGWQMSLGNVVFRDQPSGDILHSRGKGKEWIPEQRGK